MMSNERLSNRMRVLRPGLMLAGVYLAVVLFVNLGCQKDGGERVTEAEEIQSVVVTDRPLETPGNGGYVGAAACAQCHKGEHKSWATSWHHTMTQVVSEETVAGRFDGEELEFYGWKYRPFKRDGKYFMGIEGTQSGRKFEHELLMSTGSHHMQKYWYATGKGRELGLAPLVYVIESDKWIPEHTAFLRPTEDALAVREGDWNRGCNQCHATGAEPRLNAEGGIDTRVAEFGISCEACHGPGEKHVLEMTAFEMAGKKVEKDTELHITQPADLTSELSSQVCGQCHGAWVMKDFEGADWANTGHSFRPGDDIAKTRHYIHGNKDKHLREQLKAEDSFWSDGQSRVAGREYNGMLGSACATHGGVKQMSCISCHDMHATTTKADKSWANDQLGKNMETNAACYQCHESYRDKLVEHTHHPAGSAGSSCYNCHMPHTSYGLLKAVRSHTITSPSVAESLETGRPNACNQCHLDKSLEWTAQNLNQFYGQEIPELGAEQKEVAASVSWMLKGDAGQRALMAWSLGWDKAQEASGTAWMPFFVTDLMFDDYDAIRYIAHRSLNTLPGFEKIEFDHMHAKRQEQQVMAKVMEIWFKSNAENPPTNNQLLYDDTGNIRMDVYEKLRSQRDNRKVIITE